MMSDNTVFAPDSGIDTSRLVVVRWVDSCQSDGWGHATVEDWAMPDMRIVSVGYLLRETEEAITITASVGAYAVLGPLTIPRVAITDMEVISANSVDRPTWVREDDDSEVSSQTAGRTTCQFCRCA